jgi:FkbM family methyltransferase
MRWRDNYYVSLFLVSVARPLYFASARLATQIQRKVHKNGVTIRLPNGEKMKIGRDSGVGIASALFWHGLDGYESETSRALRFLFERSSAFIDVGANYGFYSLLAALWNPKLRVIAFEPVPKIYEGLLNNVALNQLQERILCENLALADKSGNATFFLPESDVKDLETTGTLVADGWQARKGAQRIQVETVRLDDYETHPPVRVDVIKIDVEDFEADVLAGMRQTIKRDRPFIVCEILPRVHRNERTRKIVESLEYQPYWITPSGYIRVSGFDFSRSDFHNFLLSPVTTSENVLQDLEVLWNLRCARAAA